MIDVTIRGMCEGCGAKLEYSDGNQNRWQAARLAPLARLNTAFVCACGRTHSVNVTSEFRDDLKGKPRAES